MLQPLSLLIFLPVVFAVLMAFLPANNNRLVHIVANALTFGLFGISVYFFMAGGVGQNPYTEVVKWLPGFGIAYKLQADQLSWTLVLLTTFLMSLASLASISAITKRVRLYYSMLFLITTSLLGVFLARDLFLFFLFWELELIPMYFLIAIWGGKRREYASMKFVLYTLFGSAFMVVALLALFFFSKKVLGQESFDFTVLSTMVSPKLALGTQILLFLGFFMPFCIKLPMVPFHTWLPDAHVEAPTPVSMLLAGIMLKMGAYGMVRFCFTWFPDAAVALAPYMVLLGVINIVYTAGVAMVQADLKKLIAYSSVSHMGFVLVGLGALNAIGFNGAVFQMISHGLISAGLFMMVGSIYNRTHTREIAELGGLGKVLPSVYFFGVFLAMASLGLPLLAGFPAETLVFYAGYLSKAFTAIPWFGGVQLALSVQTLTIIAAIGVVLAAAYLLWMVQRVFCGNLFERWVDVKDIQLSEATVFSVLAISILAVGFFPNKLAHYFEPQVTAMAAPIEQRVTAKNMAAKKPAVAKNTVVMVSTEQPQ